MFASLVEDCSKKEKKKIAIKGSMFASVVLIIFAFLGELIFKLKVTKQSLNRILNDLLKFNIISFVKDEKDSRMKHVHLTKKGEEVFNEIFS